MPRTAGSRNKPKVAYHCDKCGETGFATKKCPRCGNLNTLELNEDGIPITDVQHAIGVQPQMPIILGAAPEFMDPNAEMKKLVSDEQSQAIAEMNLDKVKAKAASAKADRIREEEELALTEKGFRKPVEHKETPNPMMPQQQIGIDPSMLLSNMGKWDPDARKDLFDRLTQDDDFALNLSRAFNSVPQQQMPMTPQQMMNPWMNPMMQQPQAPPEPQESAASMMSAVIAAVAQIKELAGGNDDGSNAATDRLIDRMERMEERQAERDTAMQQKMMEVQQRMMEVQQNQGNNQITPADVQQIVHSTVANSSTDQLAASIESINGVVTGLQSLGVVKRADGDAKNDKHEFEKMKWKDEVALKREDRTREDARDERVNELEIAKQEATSGMVNLMLDMSKVATETDENEEDTKAEPLPPAVARAVVS